MKPISAAHCIYVGYGVNLQLLQLKTKHFYGCHFFINV